jgi:hypothetical protein
MDLPPGSEQEDFLHQTIGGDEEDAFGFVDPAESVAEVAEHVGFGYAAPPANHPHKYAVPGALLRHEQEEDEDQVYKAKYRAAKKKFFKAVEKHEYLKSELRTRQKKLQQVEEDKYFLLERMLLYEKAPESPVCGLSDGSDWEESDAAAATPGGKKGGGTKATSVFNSGGVTFSSAFSKMKSLSAAGKRTRRPAAKAKLFDEVFDSPTVSSFGAAFDDEAQSSSFLAGGIGGVMEDDSE